MNDEVRLERIREVLDRLAVLSEDHVILVEGVNDVAALKAVGIDGDFFTIQCSGGPMRAVEYVEAHGGKAVVLTDWDRRGGTIASQIRSMCGSGHDIDFDVRADLGKLCRTYIKDIESLAVLVERLSPT